jgi:hypothetical protein
MIATSVSAGPESVPSSGGGVPAVAVQYDLG